MAARENQGYLIAVIVLVLVSLVLALTTFLGVSKMNEYGDNKAATDQKLLVEETVSKANEMRGSILEAMIGGDAAPTMTEMEGLKGNLKQLASKPGLDSGKARVQSVIDSVDVALAAFEKDMRANGSTGPQEQDGTYKQLVKNLTTVLSKKHNEMNVLQQRAKLAKQDADTAIKNKEAEVQSMTGKIAQLEKDLGDERETNAKNVMALTTSLETGKQEIIQVNSDFSNFKTVANDTEERLTKEKGDALVSNADLKDQLNEIKREVFDAPDGRVVKVASALNSVFIDLGRLDGLEPNRAFVIYDQSVTNFEKDRHKATIEVIRVLESQAEARITGEDPTNPILSGDHVLTAVWDPGHTVRMALAGKFDMDKDGYDDTDKLEQLIKRNGGIVVARHNQDGEIEGKIDSSVRYLVLGEAPNLGIDANPAVVRAMEKMEAMADENTVQTIDLRKLLIKMGVRNKAKIEKLDSRIGEFETRDPSDTLKSSDR